jgi:hypothetical protein
MRQGINGLRGVHAGSCHAWPLPTDATCATVARQVFRDTVPEVGLEPDLLDDCILMASELAANTLHARAVAGPGGGGDRFVSVAPDMGGEPMSSAGPAPHTAPTPPTPQTPTGTAARPATVPGYPELWLYLRGLGPRRELVCKVFDCYRGWRHGSAPSAARVPVQSVTGRGLQIVHELSRGRWGHHPTRARLGGWGVRGKAVWFAVPAPLAHARLVDAQLLDARLVDARLVDAPVLEAQLVDGTGLGAYPPSPGVAAATRAGQHFSARQAAGELEAMLDERGLGGRLVRADQAASDLSVLSVCPGLTVRCRSGVVSLTSPAGDRERWSYADLVEAVEQTVRRHEELEPRLDLAAIRA